MMFRAATTRLLLRCLLLVFADIPSKANTQTTEKSTTAAKKSSHTCPDGWVTHKSAFELTCLLLDREARNYNEAREHCKSLGGHVVTFADDFDKTTYVNALGGAVDGLDFWVGLYMREKRRYGDNLGRFQWQESNDQTVLGDWNKLPQKIKDAKDNNVGCFYVNKSDAILKYSNCDDKRFSVCEKSISCQQGYFGHLCEKECHCHGEICNPSRAPGYNEISCRYGCQRNWIGDSCDKEKQYAEVRYFCVNSPEEGGKYVQIALYNKGISYSAVYGLLANKAVGTWCNSTTIDPYPDVSIIKIPIDDDSIAEMSEGKCCGEKLQDDIYSWTIAVKEYPGILLEHDVMVNVTCDFSQAKSLVSAGTYDLEGSKPHQIYETQATPDSINDDVKLRFIDPQSGQQVHEVHIGTPVVLQLQYGLKKGSVLKRVFPYNCAVSTSDGKQVRKLLDKNGCPVTASPIKPFSDVNNALVTPLFNAFAIEGHRDVTFQCYLQLCFESYCKVGCENYDWLHRFARDTRDRKEEDQYVTTSTLRVLPRIQSPEAPGTSHNQEYQPGPAPGTSLYEAGPFVYLNPVTCTLFLVILLVFFCMYISFLRTLRKSVYDIRKEIEVNRSRDNYGCDQQKDKDFLLP
jgi:hypothetical protein